MVDWKNIKLVYGDNTLEHIAKHKVSLSEVHNVLDGYFIPYRINFSGVLRYLVAGRIVWQDTNSNLRACWN